jgi:hypothetical protein
MVAGGGASVIYADTVGDLGFAQVREGRGRPLPARPRRRGRGRRGTGPRAGALARQAPPCGALPEKPLLMPGIALACTHAHPHPCFPPPPKQELGNYGEYSGAPNTSETYQYARTVIQTATCERSLPPAALCWREGGPPARRAARAPPRSAWAACGLQAPGRGPDPDGVWPPRTPARLNPAPPPPRPAANPDGRGRALLIGGGIANFTDVAATFKGIIQALREQVGGPSGTQGMQPRAVVIRRGPLRGARNGPSAALPTPVAIQLAAP